MFFENNFVPVGVGNGATMLDPVLKLRLSLGRWNPESAARGGTTDIILYYDPEIRPDRLTMPVSAKHKILLDMLGANIQVEVFRSPQSKQIVKIIADINEGDDEVALVHGGGSDPTFRYKARLIEMAVHNELGEKPWQTLLYMLKSIPLIPHWQTEYALPWGVKRVSFYVKRPLALELARYTDFQLPDSDDELVRISSMDFEA